RVRARHRRRPWRARRAGERRRRDDVLHRSARVGYDAAVATILIIDDNDTIREGLAITVKKLGHQPVTAASGTAGITAFKRNRADFVITDLKMEGGTGVDVLKGITALDPDVPIMIITGFGTVETA